MQMGNDEFRVMNDESSFSLGEEIRDAGNS